MGLQSGALLRRAVDLILPHQCAACREIVEGGGMLCGACWRQTPFVTGLVCDGCGVPLPGECGDTVHCDECLAHPPAWDHGRAATIYRDVARRLVLGLKHGDRLDLVGPASEWMARAAQPLLRPETIVVPVPVHRWRLIRRRYNQAALLGRGLARRCGLDWHPDALVRARSTGSQDHKSREERFANVSGAIEVNPRRARALAGRDVLLVDDVMTSGATLTACTEALRQASAASVSVVVLARAARDA
ncbi:ComF family protein [Roseitranquillus sediminis]|uniref:ComF family protein n=1 Tax=Roseitranquillus sediminis TaxID=2809051 RepID=UPI001D0C493C|nr:ComF family protein [Roseitranquillus sediminis]MBM9593761.1 ComF family protein [Roseitranquillus sediminis]